MHRGIKYFYTPVLFFISFPMPVSGKMILNSVATLNDNAFPG